MKIAAGIFRFTLTFILATVAVLVAMELFLRDSEIQLPGVTRYDPVLGTALKANRRIIRFSEGFYMGWTNNEGYYGHDFPSGDSGALRIAVMGDSYVEAHHLFPRDHFGAVMERRFKEKFGMDVVVMNFGRAGVNLSDLYCYYKDFALKFKPDVTIFVIGPRDLDRSPRRALGPYCYLENDSLKINYDFAQSTAFQSRLNTQFIRGTSAVLNMVSAAGEAADKGLGPEIVWGKFYWHKENRNEEYVINPSETTRRILEELSKDPNIYLALTNDAPREVVHETFRDPSRVFELSDCLKDVDNPRWWIATNKGGHWNHRAHKAIGEYLTDRLHALLY